MNGLLNAEFTPVRTSSATAKVGTVSVELRGTDVVVGIVLVGATGTVVVVGAGSLTQLAAATDVGEDVSTLL
jgi:hypothetical protein